MLTVTTALSHLSKLYHPKIRYGSSSEHAIQCKYFFIHLLIINFLFQVSMFCQQQRLTALELSEV